MTSVGTVNVANLTPHERIEVVTTVIGVPSGLMSAATPKSLIAIDPIGDGNDYDCEWYPQGPTRADGSYRNIRILFPCKVAAGVDVASRGDGIPHEYYTLRQVQIEAVDTDAAIPAWTQHGDVDLGSLSLEFSYACARFGEGATVRTAAFTGDSGYVMQRDGSAADTSITELDTGWSGGNNRWVRSWVIPVRILPEHMGGTEDEASFYGRLIIEVPTAAIDGLGRSVKFWFEWGNSLVTSDDPNHATDPARDPTHTGYQLRSAPQLSIDGAQIALYNPDAFMPPSTALAAANTQSAVAPALEDEVEQASTAAALTLLDPFDPRNANPDRFNIGTNRVCCGVLYFEFDIPTALEGTSWQAQSFDNGDQAWMDAVWDGWSGHDGYGVFGVVFDRSDGHWATETEFWESAAKVAHEDRRFYTARDPWPSRVGLLSRHGCAPRPGQQGGQNDFGLVHYTSIAMTGFPDLRAARLSAQLEGARPFAYRLLDGTPFDPAVRLKPGGPSIYTHVMMYFVGEPKNQGSYAVWADHLGKNSDAEDNRRKPPNAGGYEVWAGTHVSSNCALLYGHLSGDRWFLNGPLQDYENMALCSFPELIPETYGPYNGIDLGMNSPRANGRFFQMSGHAWSLGGNIEIARKNLKRTGQIHEYAAVSRPLELHGQVDLFRELSSVCVNRAGGYCTNESWSTWLEGMNAAGFYAMWRMCEHYTDAALPERVANVPKLREILEQMSKAQIVHGWRKNAQTNNEWDSFYWVDYEWDGSANRGDALDGTGDTWDRTAINPNTGENYFGDGSGSAARWGWAGTMLGPLFNPTDAAVRSASAKVDPDAEPMYPTAATRGENQGSYPYGFGRNGESWFSWGAIFPNAFERWRGYSAGAGQIHQRSAFGQVDVTSSVSRTVIHKRTIAGTISITSAVNWGGAPIARTISGAVDVTSSVARRIVRSRSVDASVDITSTVARTVNRGGGGGGGGSGGGVQTSGRIVRSGTDPRRSRVRLIRIGNRIIRIPGFWLFR